MRGQPFVGFVHNRAIDPALIIEGRRCPKCGSAMFVKEACCGWSKAGWIKILRCVKSGCPYSEGLEKEK
jgi:hypothetical protein